MAKIAFMFPGQGSQFLGMGYDLFHEYDFVREIFDATDEITKENISKLCFKGPFDVLSKNVNLQPAITAVNLACLSVIKKEGINCNLTAGHSLGEYSSLRAAQIVSLSDTISLITVRGHLMEKEAIKRKGKMSVLIGLELEGVKSLINECQASNLVSIANYNNKNQITISGDADSVDRVVSACTSKFTRAVPLKVSGAWHSSLMRNAGIKLKPFLDTIKFNTPKCKMIHNVNANVAEGEEKRKDLLARQVYSPVLWYNSMRKLINEKVEVFVEVGPGKILTGLAKKILPDKRRYKVFNVCDMSTLEKFLNYVS